MPQVPAAFNPHDYYAQPYRRGDAPANPGARADNVEQAQIEAVQAVAAHDDPDNGLDRQGEPARTESQQPPVFNGANGALGRIDES